ncbi:MAG TPA: hypothetical protein VKV28_14035 [Candidatus Binataceae bacterium]|nr:hypothetical protein [Candidatus Binataceae bacterium]
MKKKATAMPPRPAPKAKAKSGSKRPGKITTARRAVRRPSRAPAPSAANSALTEAVASLAAIAAELRQALEALRELIALSRTPAGANAQVGESEVSAVVITDEEA